MAIRTPRLLRSRHGVFYWRYISRSGTQRKISLGTKDPTEARRMGAWMNYQFEQLKLEWRDQYRLPPDPP